MTRIVVLISGHGSTLQALIDAKTRGDLPSAKLVLVLSSKPGVPALRRAREVLRGSPPLREDGTPLLDSALLATAIGEADLVLSL